MALKVIITGATGMIGEGVLFECLENPLVTQVLIITRTPYAISENHKSIEKLKTFMLPDFFKLDEVISQGVLDITPYDACFYCAGPSSVGMTEAEYYHQTCQLPVYFGSTLLKHALDGKMSMCHISGQQSSDGEEKVMWKQVKRKTEIELSKLPFNKLFNFRPGVMKPSSGQKNVRMTYKIPGPIVGLFKAGGTCTLKEVGKAMINLCLLAENPLADGKIAVEVEDIVQIAKMELK